MGRTGATTTANSVPASTPGSSIVAPDQLKSIAQPMGAFGALGFIGSAIKSGWKPGQSMDLAKTQNWGAANGIQGASSWPTSLFTGKK